ncbi:hypothetical protein [Mucilaginibacter antarcticus]
MTVVVRAVEFKKEVVSTQKADLNEDKKAASEDSKETFAATLVQAFEHRVLLISAVNHPFSYAISYCIACHQRIPTPPPDLT